MIEPELEAMHYVGKLLIPATVALQIPNLTLGKLTSHDGCQYSRLEPCVQLPVFGDYSPLHLFQLFFSKRLMTTLIQDTNKFNDERKARENKCYRVLKHVTSPEFKFFIAIFMGLVNVPTVKEFWVNDAFFGQIL